MNLEANTTQEYTEDEYNTRMRNLAEKLKRKEKLTLEEKYFFADHTSADYLLNYAICIDEFYCRYYLDNNSNYANETPLYNWTARHQSYYEALVREWANEISKSNHTDQLLKIISEETRKELQLHRRDKRLAKSIFLIDRYIQEKFLIYAWSKYRYLLIKRTFEMGIGKPQYSLHLNGKEIIYNYFSLVHIVTHHFGEPMKPYKSGKDHFHDTFYYNNIHLKLNEIFGKIDTSGLYISQSIEEINFRFHGRIYKIFCKNTTFQQKGIPDVAKARLNSFFPVSNKEMLNRLSEEFEEQIINGDLSVFIKKVFDVH